jgi:hypothetical protein
MKPDVDVVIVGGGFAGVRAAATPTAFGGQSSGGQEHAVPRVRWERRA